MKGCSRKIPMKSDNNIKQKVLKTLVLLSSVFFIFPDYSLAETFKLTCVYKKGNSGAVLGESGTYIVDNNKKLIKYDCDDCPWNQTIYWGDDYIVTINAPSNMATSFLGFYQSTLSVLNLETMVKYGVTINEDTFSSYDLFKEFSDFDGTPTFAASECTRKFNN